MQLHSNMRLVDMIHASSLKGEHSGPKEILLSKSCPTYSTDRPKTSPVAIKINHTVLSLVPDEYPNRSCLIIMQHPKPPQRNSVWKRESIEILNGQTNPYNIAKKNWTKILDTLVCIEWTNSPQLYEGKNPNEPASQHTRGQDVGWKSISIKEIIIIQINIWVKYKMMFCLVFLPTSCCGALWKDLGKFLPSSIRVPEFRYSDDSLSETWLRRIIACKTWVPIK